MVSFTTLLTLAAGAIAAPTAANDTSEPPKQVLPPGYPSSWAWHVEDFEAGCTRGGCFYRFNLTSPPVPDKAIGCKWYCSGTENGGYGNENFYENCRMIDGVNIGASAKLSKRANDVPRQLFISVNVPGWAYEPKRHAYNFTAITDDWTYNQSVAPEEEFDVYPTIWQQLPIPEPQPPIAQNPGGSSSGSA
jgi:hypothetical protein